MLVTFTDPVNIADYRDRHGYNLPVVVDHDRSAYRTYGLDSGSITQIWNLQSAKRYAEIIRADGPGALKRPTEDTRQLGGDFIIDPDGILIYGFWSQGPADRPDVELLAAALTGGAGFTRTN